MTCVRIRGSSAHAANAAMDASRPSFIDAVISQARLQTQQARASSKAGGQPPRLHQLTMRIGSLFLPSTKIVYLYCFSCAFGMIFPLSDAEGEKQ